MEPLGYVPGLYFGASKLTVGCYFIAYFWVPWYSLQSQLLGRLRRDDLEFKSKA